MDDAASNLNELDDVSTVEQEDAVLLGRTRNDWNSQENRRIALAEAVKIITASTYEYNEVGTLLVAKAFEVYLNGEAK